MKDLLQDVIQVIRGAGDVVLKHYDRDAQDVRFKDPGDPVTQADLDAAEFIERGLRPHQFGFLCEETNDDSTRLQEEFVWIVDPLDGTKDFIGKTDEFTVMIGLVKDQRPVMGLVYQPSQDDLYFALKGQGAYVQHGQDAPQRLQTSMIGDPSQARMLTSRYHHHPDEQNLAKALGILSLTPCGSAGLKTCHIARQNADLYLNTSDKTSEWDTCAADLILHEAGGHFMDGRGQTILYNQPVTRLLNGFIATNGLLTPHVVNHESLTQR